MSHPHKSTGARGKAVRICGSRYVDTWPTRVDERYVPSPSSVDTYLSLSLSLSVAGMVSSVPSVWVRRGWKCGWDGHAHVWRTDGWDRMGPQQRRRRRRRRRTRNSKADETRRCEVPIPADGRSSGVTGRPLHACLCAVSVSALLGSSGSEDKRKQREDGVGGLLVLAHHAVL
ncbi:hypothetical protein LZ30DRAFT_460995 [Colletotrichum cereale]|nr:hypothetical protein LZ30DRAFT_460995 [Colletotrichum cereale]